MIRQVQLPLAPQLISELRAGDELELSGNVLTGRDQACARLVELIRTRQSLPVDLKHRLLYFVGPSPTPPGKVIGAAGPTTTGRMNRHIPTLLAEGLNGIVGKGYLASGVKTALRQHRAIYFGAIGGTGALLSQSITHSEVIAFDDLLSEAIRRLTLKNFPVVVLYDTVGGDLYLNATGSSSQP